jgi:hypothetical protein
MHRGYVELTDAIVERLQGRPDLPGQRAVAELMGDSFRVMAEHWERVERTLGAPPAPAAAARGR